MTEQFYKQLVELYEQRGTPLRIKKQIELVLTEHNRLKETRLNPLTIKTIQEVPAHWARPSIEMIPESESTPNVDISTVIDVISKIEPSIRLDLLENNTIKNNTIKNKARHLEMLSKPVVAFESDSWLKADIEKAIRQLERQHSMIAGSAVRNLPLVLPANFKLPKYTRRKIEVPDVPLDVPVIGKVKNEIDIDLSKLLDMSLSVNELELLDVKPIDNIDGSQIARMEHIPKLRKSWKGVSRVRQIDIKEIIKRVGYIKRSVNRTAKLAPLPQVHNKVRSLLGFMPHIPKYESIDLIVTQDIYMYVSLRDVFLKYADDILAAQHRTSAEIDAWDVYVVQNWQDKDLFHDFVLDHYAPTFEAFNSLERLIIDEFIANQWQIYNEHARTARQEVLGMNLTAEQIKNLPSNPDHDWVSSSDLNLPTKK